jgi:glucose/arabinose dehydrogenase
MVSNPRTVALLLLCAAVCLPRPAGAQLQITTRLIASGLSAPLDFVQDPSDPDVQYVVQQGGRIRVLRLGVLQPADFLNLAASIASGGERGLLGLAFPSDYATSGVFYVNFTRAGDGATVIARFRRSTGNPRVADPTSRFDLAFGGLRYIPQPASNHNGGHLAFGPDGYLYIGMGDGGGSNDPNHLAQNPQSRLGKFLRIDVVPPNNTTGYAIPSDNPFVGTSTLPEIWSFGWRNPWKFSFDDQQGGTGALIVGDVGQNLWEEVDYEPSGEGGRNYGWRNREGAHNNTSVPTLPPAYLPLTDPILEYDHTVGRSITGGYVYRGRFMGETARGRYFYGDFITGRLWSVGLTIGPGGEATATGRIEHTAQVGGAATLGNISSFGRDAAGELYVVSYSRGMVLQLIGPPPPPPPNLRIVR